MNKSLEILIFALLAAYLFFRLWTVLGKRPGSEEGGNGPSSPESSANRIISDVKNNVIPLRKEITVAALPDAPIAEDAKKSFEKLLEKDPSFDVHGFLRGAKRAFTMIVKDFASGDKASLRKLLNDTVLKQFSKAIDARIKTKQTSETEVIDILESSIQKIEFRGERAYITVRFKSEQVTLTMDEEGQIIDNPARLSSKVTDIWTFSRDINADSPHWILSGTRTEDEG